MLRQIWMGAAALAMTSAMAWGESAPRPFKDFTFKRIGLPAPGSTHRILVQIDPQPEPEPAPAVEPAVATDAMPELSAPEAGPAARSGDGFAWYWDAVSPRISSEQGGRFLDAVAALDRAPGGTGVPTPRLATLQRIARVHGTDILKATIGTRVSPALVLAMIAVESSGVSDAVSPVGAAGLMQLMPDTATRFGVRDRDDPRQNIRGGTAYIDWLMGEFGQDAVLALAGYNAGEGAVQRAGGVPEYNETRAYVPKVLAAWKVARSLCITPPMLPGDGCVFGSSMVASNG